MAWAAGLGSAIGGIGGSYMAAQSSNKAARTAALAQKYAVDQSLDAMYKLYNDQKSMSNDQLGANTDWFNNQLDIGTDQYNRQLNQGQDDYNYKMGLGNQLDQISMNRYAQDYGAGNDAYALAQQQYQQQMGLGNMGYANNFNTQQQQLGIEDSMRQAAYQQAAPWQQGAQGTYQSMLADYNKAYDPATDPLRAQTEMGANRQALRYGLGGGAGANMVQGAMTNYDLANRDKQRSLGQGLATLGGQMGNQYLPTNVSMPNQINNQSIGLQPGLMTNPLLGQNQNPMSQTMNVTPTYINDPRMSLANPQNPMLGQNTMGFAGNVGNVISSGGSNLANIYMSNGANQANAYTSAGKSFGNGVQNYYAMQNLYGGKQ